MPTTAPAAPLLDVRAARLSQGLTALLVWAAVATRAWPLLALPAIHLGLSFLLGKQANLALRAFDALLLPRLGPGEVEDARPVRFANLVGLLCLAGAMAAAAAGAGLVAWALAATVAVLATLAVTTGFCLGCRIYGLYRRVSPLLGEHPDARHGR